jgi:hypothetical protein
MVVDGIIKKFIAVDLSAEDVDEQIVAAVNGLSDEVRTRPPPLPFLPRALGAYGAPGLAFGTSML